MVDDLIMTAYIGVFVFQGIEAMWTGRNDLPDLICVEYLDVCHGLHLEQEFITRSFGGITGTGLFGTQYGVFHSHMLQNPADVAGDALSPLVITARTADPE